jgi:hypothetical protein
MDVENYIQVIGWKYEGAVKHKKFSYPNKTPIMLSKGKLSIGQKSMALIEAEKVLTLAQKERLDATVNFAERLKEAKKINLSLQEKFSFFPIEPLRIYQSDDDKVLVKIESQQTGEKKPLYLQKEKVQIDKQGMIVAVEQFVINQYGLKTAAVKTPQKRY